MRLSLQTHYGILIGEDHPIVLWLIREAAESINRYQVGPDGKTRRQRLTGKEWNRTVAEFGECVYYCQLKSKASSGRIKNTWDERWLKEYG